MFYRLKKELIWKHYHRHKEDDFRHPSLNPMVDVVNFLEKSCLAEIKIEKPSESQKMHQFYGLPVDPRLCNRADTILSTFRKKPSLGFPEIFEIDSELEAAYRFFSNPRINFDMLLDAHLREVRGVIDSDVVLSLEDTTYMIFDGNIERMGLGRINNNNRGFLGHFALLASADGKRRPYGVGAAELWVRPEKTKKKSDSNARRRDEDRESLRWQRVASKVEHEFENGPDVIHVQDREGDIYQSIAWMCKNGHRFVTRCLQDRRIVKNDNGDNYLFEALDGLGVLGTYIVDVSARPGSKLPDQRKTHPPRKARKATVSVTSTSVTVRAPVGAPKDWAKTIQLNLVHVFEPCPPSGEEPLPTNS